MQGGCPFGYGRAPAESQGNGHEKEEAEHVGGEQEGKELVGKKLSPGEVYYADYLQLEKLLSCQHMMSVEKNAPAHDEMLFIVVHQVRDLRHLRHQIHSFSQVYELWFKQIIHELDLVISIFQQVPLPERFITKANHHLERVSKIQKLLIEQIQIIETMSPLDFLDFRDLLYPASGFQSFQFRLVENKMVRFCASNIVHLRPVNIFLGLGYAV